MDETKGKELVITRGPGAAAIYTSPSAILRPADAMIPPLGKIRAGIKVLKKAGTTDKDRAVYKKGVAGGLRWDEIDKELGTDEKGKTKLIPINVGYFFIRPIDCVNPNHAQEIRGLPGVEVDEAGHVTAFPVAFYSDNWWDIVQHSYICWGSQAIQYRSEIAACYEGTQITGVERYCLAAPDPIPGVRPSGIQKEWPRRKDNEGLCRPDVCKEYQANKCKLEGAIRCYIPGLKGHGLWQVTTHSYYSLIQITKTLSDVATITGGRLRLLAHEGKTIFTLRKVKRTVTQIDPADGMPKKREQYLVVLDVNVDEFALAQAYEERAMLERGRAAAAALAGGRPGLSPRELPAGTDPDPEKAIPDPIDEGDDDTVDYVDDDETITLEPSNFRLVESEEDKKTAAAVAAGEKAIKDATTVTGSGATDAEKEKAGLIDDINFLKKELGDEKYQAWRERTGLRVSSTSTVEQLRHYVAKLREEDIPL